MLAIRVGVVASDLIQAESIDPGVVRLVLDQAVRGEDVEAITVVPMNLRYAVVATESVTSARRSSAGQDQVVTSEEESPAGGPGKGGDSESAGADRPEEGELKFLAQVGTPSDSEPSGSQDSVELTQGSPS